MSSSDRSLSQKEVYSQKICLIGDSEVGKSNLLLRFYSNKFNEFHHSTIGAALLTKSLVVDENYDANLECWDTAGQERFRPLLLMYLRNAYAVIVVFVLTSMSSFKHVEGYLKTIRDSCENGNVKILLVGNKSDLVDQRQVDQNAIDALKNDKENRIFDYIESSAKNNTNVSKVFSTIVDEIRKDLTQSKKGFVRIEQTEEKSSLLNGNHSSEQAPFVPKKSLVKPEELSSSIGPTLRVILMLRLEAYIARIEKYLHEAEHGSERSGFSRGFWFFQKSRTVNRKVNYVLAKKFLEALEKSQGTAAEIEEIFSNPNEKREHYSLQLEILEDVKIEGKGPDINSKELNTVIELAHYHIRP